MPRPDINTRIGVADELVFTGQIFDTFLDQGKCQMSIHACYVGQTITIGNSISVTVLSIVGNEVQYRVTAPRNIEIYREEIYYRIQRQKACGIA